MSDTREEIRNDMINNKFKYHAPTPEQILKYNALREKFRELALLIVDLTPICPDQTVAIRKLHEASMSVNATIACNEEPR